MTESPNRMWWVVITAWIGVIFFSSTSLAGQLSEQAFSAVAATLFGSLEPTTSGYDWLHLIADKGLHVTMFLVLAILLWQAVPRSHWKIPLILLGGLIVGSCSEFLQRFFPDRDPAIRDVIINVAGDALGLAVCLLVVRLHARRRASVEHLTE